MNDIHKDIVQINKIVKVYKKVIFFAGFIILANLISSVVDNDFANGFFSVVNPFLTLAGASVFVRAFSGNNYILISTLPVKLNNITEIIFRLFEVTCVISYGGCCIISLMKGNYTGILSCLLLLMVTLIFGYISISALSSEQLAVWMKQVASTAKGFALYMIFFVVFMALNSLIIALFEEFKKSVLLIIFSIAGILVLTVITFFTRRLTYQKTYNKIRGIKTEKKA